MSNDSNDFDAAVLGGDISPVQIEDEMRESYIDYAMSVIVSRALPDVRDGLKPVHRRILYGMSELSLAHNKPFKKSARIVGEVMGKFHPHGDSAIYDTLVRMAQDFSLRYPLVDGQGNFGSVDGDPPAAMRYTEARLQRVAEEMLADIEKETVSFQPNFDDSMQEPTVLPSRIPNLLVNGSDGIAVGMATKMPPHNLGEVVDALTAMIDDPTIDLDGLMKHIKGPDFPTGGYIVSNSEIRKGYETGRGRVVIRAKSHVETLKNGKERIIVTEIPYQVNKAKLLEDIANLVKEKRVEGISDLRDESDRRGMRVVIELKRNESPELITNQLLKFTQLQQTFGINMVALVNNRPLTLGLRRICQEYIKHRKDVIIRRTRYELRKALERLHILEGLKIALDNIDAVIALIKAAPDVEAARTGLMSQFGLSDIQARAILDMKLQKLTSLETEKIIAEYEEIKKRVAELRAILADMALVMGIVKDELLDVKAKYADGRRTTFIVDTSDFDARDLLVDQTKVITVSANGYIKAIGEETYRRQRRGGKGLRGVGLKEEDMVDTIFTANTFDQVLFFTNRGKVYCQEVFKLPEGDRTAKGRPLVNLLNLAKEEVVTAILPIAAFEPDKFIVQSTKKGLVKRTSLEKYKSCTRTSGIIGIKFASEDDELIRARITDGKSTILLGTKQGKCIRFDENEVREAGRGTQGVRGITLAEGDEVVGMEAVSADMCLLVVTEMGYGKRTDLEEYRIQGRGGQGIINIKVNPRNGTVAAFREVGDDDEVIVSTKSGKFIRVLANSISRIGRNTQGVRIIELTGRDRVIGITILKSEGDELPEGQGDAASPRRAPAPDDDDDPSTDDLGADESLTDDEPVDDESFDDVGEDDEPEEDEE